MKNETKKELGKSFFQFGNVVVGVLLLPQMLQFFQDVKNPYPLIIIPTAFVGWLILHALGISLIDSSIDENKND